MVNPQHFDVIVIGSGPGGEGAAMKAAKENRRAALIERHPEVGGGCTHWGTIPSKALRHAISRLADLRANSMLAKNALAHTPDFQDMVKTANSVISRQVQMRSAFYERNHIHLVEGNARFVDANTIEVEEAKGAREVFTANSFVIATGSRPHRPKDVDFSHPRIYDSDKILSLKGTINSITIYGAGVIGCEYASMFRNLGIKVNLVNTRERVLSFLDDEICDALAYHMREQGVLIRNLETYEKVEPENDGVVLYLKSGKKLKSDIILWANGRAGNSSDMNLEKINVALDPRGNITVNENFQTSVPHIYAVGDVIGFPSLASAAYDQGRFATTHIVHGKCDDRLVKDIPTGIYTSPEISSVGQTERELTEAKVPYEVGHAFYKHLARAQIIGQTAGILKILFHRETLEVLGIHCFGNQASEIVHIGQAIMTQKGAANTLLYFINTTFNYPTMAEAYRVAALNGYNRIF